MKKLVGVIATVALFGSGAAFAQDSTQQQQQPSSSQGSQSSSTSTGTGGTGGSSTMGTSSAMGQKELTGKVVRADSKTIYVDMQGAVVPLTVDKSTQFNDPNVKRAKDLQAGQEIRASYEVKNTENLAKSISMAPATGGAGSETMSPDSSINQSPDTGGSGSQQNKNVEQGTDTSSGSSTMNPDTY